MIQTRIKLFFRVYILCYVLSKYSLFCFSQNTKSYIQNPIISDYTVHDVSIIQYKNSFYAFASCVAPRDKNEKINYMSVQIFKSSNMVDWSYYKEAISDKYKEHIYVSEEDKKKNRYQIWAPDIIQYKGKLLLFVAFRSSFDDSKIAVFESNSIDDEFIFKNIIVSNTQHGEKSYFGTREIIDPCPLVYKNKLFLVFGSFSRDVQGKELSHRKGIGTYIVPLKYGDKISMNGRPVFISDYYEGVNIQKHGKYFYLFGTNGFYTNNTYKIDFAKSRKISGPYQNAMGLSIADTVEIHQGTPILQTQDTKLRFNGFGCMSNIIVDKRGRNFVLVHGHDLDKQPIQMKTSQRERYAFLIEILWDKQGNPYFDMDAIQKNKIRTPEFN